MWFNYLPLGSTEGLWSKQGHQTHRQAYTCAYPVRIRDSIIFREYALFVSVLRESQHVFPPPVFCCCFFNIYYPCRCESRHVFPPHFFFLNDLKIKMITAQTHAGTECVYCWETPVMSWLSRCAIFCVILGNGALNRFKIKCVFLPEVTLCG